MEHFLASQHFKAAREAIDGSKAKRHAVMIRPVGVARFRKTAPQEQRNSAREIQIVRVNLREIQPDDH